MSNIMRYPSISTGGTGCGPTPNSGVILSGATMEHDPASGSASGYSLNIETGAATLGVAGVTSVTATGAVQGATVVGTTSVSDGTATLGSGSLTGAVNVTASGAVQGATVVGTTSVSDGTATLASGSLTSAVNVTASGAVQGATVVGTTSVSDGTATLSGGTLADLVAPTNDGDAANKAYVDGQVEGLKIKASARAASTADVAGNYNSGAGTLTGTPNGALANQDGVAMAAGDRLVLTAQTTSFENGIYEVTTLGDGANAFLLTRVVDADTPAELTRALVDVTEGSSNIAKQFLFGVVASLTSGSITVSQYRRRYVGDGSTIAVNQSSGVINVVADSLNASHIAANAIGASELADGAVDSGAIATGAVIAGKIADDAVTAATIATDAVTSDAIADNAVTNNKLANSSVGSLNIANGVLLTNHFIAGAVDTSALASSAVTAAKLNADVRLDSVNAPTSAVAFNSQAITGALSIAVGSLTIATDVVTSSSDDLFLGDDGAFTLARAANTSTAGALFTIAGQDAAGTNQNGGDLRLDGGVASGTGTDGGVIVGKFAALEQTWSGDVDNTLTQSAARVQHVTVPDAVVNTGRLLELFNPLYVGQELIVVIDNHTLSGPASITPAYSAGTFIGTATATPVTKLGVYHFVSSVGNVWHLMSDSVQT